MDNDNLTDVIFKVGEPLKVEYNDESGRITVFEGFVKLLKDNQLKVALPQKKIPWVIQAGATIYLVAIYKGNPQFFIAKILEIESGNQMLLIVDRPKLTDISLLRRFFRCEVHLPLVIIRNDLRSEGWIKNLSGCGLLAITRLDPNLNLEMTVDCKFDISLNSQPEFLELQGEIVRLEISSENKHLLAINFSKIDDKKQSKIIKYLFQRQREILKKMPRHQS